MTRICIAIVGPGDGASQDAIDDATKVGQLVAARGWITITGGRDVGVMRAATSSAAAVGGLTVGILPSAERRDAAADITIAIPTGLGEARNAILVAAADAVIACGMSAGTASEVALALRTGKPTVLVRPTPESAMFFATIGTPATLHVSTTAVEGVAWVAARLG
jgi:uncharacterized protein (TIGR00725 family)